MKFKSICALAFGIGMSISSALYCDIRPYLGLSAGTMFADSDHEIDIALRAERYIVLASKNSDLDDAAQANSSLHSPVGRFSLELDSGYSFGAKFGVEFDSGAFVDFELSRSNHRDEAVHSAPEYLSTREQFIDTKASKGLFNLGFAFTNQQIFNPFVSIGVGLGKFDISGDVRLSIGDELSGDGSSYLQIHELSSRRGHFQAESKNVILGSFGAGFSIPAPLGSKMLLSYRYTSALENMDLQLKKYEHNSSLHMWSGFSNPGGRWLGDGHIAIDDGDEYDPDYLLAISVTDVGKDGGNQLIGLEDRAVFDGSVDWLGKSYDDHSLEISLVIPM